VKPIVSFQFGNTYQRRAPGFVLLSGVYASPCYLWVGSVNECASRQVADPLLEGYVQSTQPAAFWMGLPDGAYRLTMTGYEPEQDHGPFTVKANDTEALRNVVIQADSIWKASFQAQSKDGVLRLAFVPAPGKDFILNGLVVEGRDDRIVPQPVFRTAPPTTLPGQAEWMAHSEEDPARVLRRICAWLVAHCRADGFIGDTWATGTDYWYTTSFPVRALLAGYDILGDERYLDAALAVLDLFVGEQLPNGAFQDRFRGKPTAELGPAELENSLQSRLPMSDVGSVVSALAIGSHYAPAPRKERYVRSVQLFCDNWASRFQQPSGGFTDGQWVPYEGLIYSCATAIEAATFSLAYAITGRTHYLKVAADAIRYLLPDWRTDGRMTGRAPHWVVRSGQPFVMESLYFGDMWYYDEGFVTTSLHAQDDDLCHRIDEALGWRVFGSQGLLHTMGGQVWWPIQNIWNNAKSIGLVQTLLHARVCGTSTPALEEALVRTRKFLCTPEFSRRLGIMVEDAEHPARVYGFQTWSGMRMEATGFAGMTLAEMIQPGVLYLASSRR